MKLLASAAACLCLLVVAVAAPAITTSRWQPEAVDFELAAPPAAAPAGSAAAGSARAGRSLRLQSRPLRAPKRFNLVGLRWRGRGEARVGVRVRRENERWSHWAILDSHGDHAPDARTRERSRGTSSQPLWVGEADWVQYRSARRLPGLRLHFVNVEGTATPGGRVRTALRRSANAATSSLAGVFGAGSAEAQEPQPEIVPRRDWGASQCPPRQAPDYGQVKAAFVHHTVSLNDYSPEEAPGIVLAICRYHRNSNGWNDIGYNFLVDRYGVLYEGRAGGIEGAVVGAQAQGFNSQSTGIAHIGDHSSVAQTPEALGATARLIRWKLPLHGAATSGRVTLVSGGGSSNRYPAGARVSLDRVPGHRDANHTACPGDALYDQLPELRAMVAGVPAGTATRLSARVSPARIDYKGRALLRGTLSTTTAGPLPNELVQVQMWRGARWLTIAGVPTGPSGDFQAEVRPTTHRRLRARFAGRGDLRASSSRAALLRLRAAVTLTRRPARGRPGARVPVRGTVNPARRQVFLVLELRRGARWRRLGVTVLRVRRGRFSYYFVPAGRGLYRFRVVAKAGRSSDRGQSRPQQVRVR